MEPYKVTQPNTFPLGLTFDDVLLLPGYADFSRSEISLSTSVTKKIKINIPFVSSPMDTVTESRLAIALAKMGGIGFIHRNFSISDQVEEVVKVKKEGLLVGAAIGAGKTSEERILSLVSAGVDVLLVDSADGFKKPVLDTTRYIKQTYPNIEVISGSVATVDGAQAVIDAGADGIRVGMGPGAICTTRIISGMGVPQITAIIETVKAARSASSGQAIPIIADGGIKYSGDMAKALAAGASAVMMGGFFASAEEAPGKVITLTRNQVPRRFQSIFKQDGEEYKFKEYRGMGSEGAMKRGSEVKSEGEFHGKSYKDRVLVAEGVEGLVPVKGTVEMLVEQAIGGIQSGMYHVGAKNLSEFWEKAKFIQITQASLTESHPHDILVTNAGKSYS